MTTVTLKKFKENPKLVLDQPFKNHEPVYVKDRTDGFVILSFEDYSSLTETLHLMRSEANVAWLDESIEQTNSGQLIPLEQISERFGFDTERTR